MINIQQTSCIKCERCIRICPSEIFYIDSAKNIGVKKPHNCIFCGHCVGVCPTASVEHTSFPPEKIHKIESEKLPSPEQVLLLCKSRRSNRAFSSKPIPKEALLKIIEAAHWAPTASNSQNVAFTLVTNPEKIAALTTYTINVYASLLKLLENPFLKPVLKCFMPDVYKSLPKLHHVVRSHKNNKDLILRGAKAVLLIHTLSDGRFDCQDANLAYQNASLMAESLGVSQFYTGFLCVTFARDKKNKLAKSLGIQGKVHAGMALGMPSFSFENYADKNDSVLSEI